MRHLQSSPSEAIAIALGSDQIGPFVSKTLRKTSQTSPALVQVRPTGVSKFPLNIFISPSTLLHKGRLDPHYFIPFYEKPA